MQDIVYCCPDKDLNPGPEVWFQLNAALSCHCKLGKPQEETQVYCPLIASGRGCLGGVQKEQSPGVWLAPATLHFLPLAGQNDVEVAQVIEELQGSILGHWKCPFFLQVKAGW